MQNRVRFCMRFFSKKEANYISCGRNTHYSSICYNARCVRRTLRVVTTVKDFNSNVVHSSYSICYTSYPYLHSSYKLKRHISILNQFMKNYFQLIIIRHPSILKSFTIDWNIVYALKMYCIIKRLIKYEIFWNLVNVVTES